MRAEKAVAKSFMAREAWNRREMRSERWSFSVGVGSLGR